MINLRETTLAELVSQKTGAADVFEKYALDFCCKGKRSLHNACQSQGLNVEAILSELEPLFQGPDSATDDPQHMPIDQLADYIVYKHHNYVRQKLPVILAHTQKVADRHGEGNPNLVRISEKFLEVAEELSHHMYKEENILFPYIKRMVEAARTNNQSLLPRQPFVSNPIRVMELEHDKAGDLMKNIRELSNQFTPPLVACTTYRLSFNELREFEMDLHRHIHLENNILFPQSKGLEMELLSGADLSTSLFAQSVYNS